MDYVVCDLPQSASVLRMVHAVRADCLVRTLRYQGDECELILCHDQHEQSSEFSQDWLALHAVQAHCTRIPQICRHVDAPVSVTSFHYRALQASVVLAGDLEWWGQGLPESVEGSEQFMRCVDLLIAINDIFLRMPFFETPRWRLVITKATWPFWQVALAHAMDKHWPCPVSVHGLPDLQPDSSSQCCPRCGAVTLGLNEHERQKLCDVPRQLQQPAHGNLRSALPLSFLKKIMACDTASCLAILSDEHQSIEQWHRRMFRQRLTDSEWQAMDTTHHRRMASLAQWCQLLIPLPAEGLGVPTPVAKKEVAPIYQPSAASMPLRKNR